MAALAGLAAGHISMLVFGDETRNFFLVIGQTVNDVRLAQNMAHMNDVILSPNCWQLCDRSMIEIERIPDQRAVKVRAPPPRARLVCARPPVRRARDGGSQGPSRERSQPRPRRLLWGIPFCWLQGAVTRLPGSLRAWSSDMEAPGASAQLWGEEASPGRSLGAEGCRWRAAINPALLNALLVGARAPPGRLASGTARRREGGNTAWEEACAVTLKTA